MILTAETTEAPAASGATVPSPPILLVRLRSARVALRGRGGWTLIELMIVISLIVVLASLAMVGYRNAITRSQEAVLKENLFRMRDAIDQYYADKAKYPADLAALVADGYIRKVPEDPFTHSADTWVAVPSEPDPNNPTAESGIFDVKSGSEAVGLDGTNYADW